MSKNRGESEKRKIFKFNRNSRFLHVSLTLLSALLTFGGPYVALVLFKAFDLNYAISMLSGLIVFLAGLALMLFLIKEKVIS